MKYNINSATQSNFNLCKNVLINSLGRFGSSLTPEIEKSFDSLIKTMDQGFKGSLEPYFYLSPIDTGLGKSLCKSPYNFR